MHIKLAFSFAVALIAFASLMLFTSSHMLLSGIYSLQTQIFLEDWQEKQLSPDIEPWQTALIASKNAQKYYPVKDAFLQEQIGKTLQWHTYDKLNTDTAINDSRLAALQAYREQTKLTPNWPKAWFNLLSIKIELNQFDNEFYNALEIAKQTTQQTPGMLTQYTIIGIQAYQGVNNLTKSEILQNILREAQLDQVNSQDLKPLLAAYGLLGITCIYANAVNANVYNLCQNK